MLSFSQGVQKRVAGGPVSHSGQAGCRGWGAAQMWLLAPTASSGHPPAPARDLPAQDGGSKPSTGVQASVKNSHLSAFAALMTSAGTFRAL